MTVSSHGLWAATDMQARSAPPAPVQPSIAGSGEERATPLTEMVAAAIATAGSDLCVATPCGVLAPLLRELANRHQSFRYIHREDNALSLAAGTVMCGGRSVVLMQNSGFGQSINVMAALVVPFGLPVGLVVSMRGTRGDRTRENEGMGRVTTPVLDHLGVPWRQLETDTCGATLGWFTSQLDLGTGPVALLVPPELFGWTVTQ